MAYPSLGLAGMERRRLWRPRLAPIVAALVAILLLAAIIHIVIVLLVPRFAEADGFSRAVQLAPVAGFGPLTPADAEGGEAALPGLDPLFVQAVCRIDLRANPAGLSFEAPGRLWTLALYDRDGTAVFSLNDRTSLDGALDMLVVTPVQNAQLRETPPADINETIVVESAATDLAAIVRVYAPDARARATVEPFLAQAECAPAPIEEAAPAPTG